MKLKLKRISSVVLAVVLALSMQISLLAAENPFVLKETEIPEGNTHFVVKLALKEITHLDAFEIYVTYDSSKLAICAENDAPGYCYSEKFNTEYGQYASKDLNALTEEGKIIFAGASVSEDHISYSGDIAELSFDILDSAVDAEDVLTNINVSFAALTIDDKDVDVSEMDMSCPITFGEAFIKGDVNGDNEVDLTDANLTLKNALNIVPFTDAQVRAADTDDNNEITLVDANMVLKAALGIVSL